MIDLSDMKRLTRDELALFIGLTAQEIKSGRNGRAMSRGIFPFLYGAGHVIVLNKLYRFDEILRVEMSDFNGRMEVLLHGRDGDANGFLFLSPLSAFLKNNPGENASQRVLDYNRDFLILCNQLISAFSEKAKKPDQLTTQ